MTRFPASKTARCALLSAIVALAGCAAENDPIAARFEGEAGAQVDAGTFGNATLNNRLVMTGQRNHMIGLAHRCDSEVTSMVTFAFNSAQLDANAQAILQQQANWIRQFPEVRFRVFGHTDLVGSESYNRALGLRRANAVVSYLSTLGISRSRLEAVVSYGETRPLIATQDRERRNRRTVTEVSGFVKGHPSLLDGKYAQVIYREYIESARPATSLSGSELTASE